MSCWSADLRINIVWLITEMTGIPDQNLPMIMSAYTCMWHNNYWQSLAHCECDCCHKCTEILFAYLYLITSGLCRWTTAVRLSGVFPKWHSYERSRPSDRPKGLRPRQLNVIELRACMFAMHTSRRSAPIGWWINMFISWKRSYHACCWVRHRWPPNNMLIAMTLSLHVRWSNTNRLTASTSCRPNKYRPNENISHTSHIVLQ